MKESARLDWDSYFINIASAVSIRSTCIRRRYGAVITKDNVIISTGYNGAAKGVPNCIDTGKCIRKELNIPSGTQYELCVAVHAEANAIIMANPEKLSGATIYLAGTEVDTELPANAHPCKMCERLVKNAGIRKIVYRDGYNVIVYKLV